MEIQGVENVRKEKFTREVQQQICVGREKNQCT